MSITQKMSILVGGIINLILSFAQCRKIGRHFLLIKCGAMALRLDKLSLLVSSTEMVLSNWIKKVKRVSKFVVAAENDCPIDLWKFVRAVMALDFAVEFTW